MKRVESQSVHIMAHTPVCGALVVPDLLDGIAQVGREVQVCVARVHRLDPLVLRSSRASNVSQWASTLVGYKRSGAQHRTQNARGGTNCAHENSMTKHITAGETQCSEPWHTALYRNTCTHMHTHTHTPSTHMGSLRGRGGAVGKAGLVLHVHPVHVRPLPPPLSRREDLGSCAAACSM